MQEVFSSAKKKSLETIVIDPPFFSSKLYGRLPQIFWIIFWPIFFFSSPVNKLLVTHSFFLLSPFIFLLHKKKLFFLFQGEEYKAFRSSLIVNVLEWILKGRFKHFRCIATNEYLYNVAIKMGGRIIRVKNNLGPKKVFFRNRSSIAPRKYVIIFARAGYNKALSDAIELARLVRYKLPVHFITPDEATFKMVLSNGFDCTLSVDSEQICSYLEQALALFLPSHYEGLSLPMLEALATGTPVVTYSEGFPRMYALHNKHVKFVAGRNATAAFQQLIEISEDSIYKMNRMPLVSIDEFSFEAYCDEVAGLLSL